MRYLAAKYFNKRTALEKMVIFIDGNKIILYGRQQSKLRILNLSLLSSVNSALSLWRA